ncbi:MAG TPA: hypothetical protein VEB21_20565, partial [Terriglobales bacterium]|nr:hypothetical protein [Terriglobales bacterium]
VRSAITDAEGDYQFSNLIDCLYQISVHTSGWSRAATEVSLRGSDVITVDLNPSSAPADVPIEIVLPAGGGSHFTQLTTAGGAGAIQPNRALQYARDAANYDIDRPPLSPQSPGLEDSNGFLGTRNPTTGSNLIGINGQINGPADNAMARKVYIAMGMPVIGTSVSGNTRLFIGANP